MPDGDVLPGVGTTTDNTDVLLSEVPRLDVTVHVCLALDVQTAERAGLAVRRVVHVDQEVFG